MLYDEEGNAFIERPLIPEEQNLMFIVKDYRRMYNVYHGMQAKIKRLQENNMKMSNRCFSQLRYIQRQRDALKLCVRLLEKNNIKLPKSGAEFKNQHRL
jgi:hypothetical protein